MNHCLCCSGKFLENDVLGDCPGCPECADKDADLAALQAATRKVVEAASRWKSAKDSAVRGFSEREPGVMTDFMGASKALLEQSIAMDDLQAALADPVITTLRRE